MMSTSPKPTLERWSRSLCVDAMFVVASSGRFDASQVAETVRRRADHYDAILRGSEHEPSWEAWLVAMSVAAAPVSVPLWMPMREVVEHSTLEGGARGVRALFTSKPSERQVADATETGRVALRCMTAVFGAGRAADEEQRLIRKCMVHALGLPDDVATMLLAEQSATIEAIEIPSGLEARLTRAIARGIWEAASRDGLDPVEDAIAAGLCARLGVDREATEELRREAQASLEASTAFGTAAVDAVRYVLSDDGRVAGVASLVARLTVAPLRRSSVLLAIEQGDLVMLARRHTLDRDARTACLALAWLAALGTDPTMTRAAELAIRHDRVATDLGTQGDGATTRAWVEDFVREQLLSAVQASGL